MVGGGAGQEVNGEAGRVPAGERSEKSFALRFTGSSHILKGPLRRCGSLSHCVFFRVEIH